MFCVRGSFGTAYSSPLGGGTLDGAVSDGPARATGRNRPLAGVAFAARSWFALLLVSTCIIGFWPDDPEDDGISGLGKRVVPIGSPAPKGGGHFKIGQPYEINGEQFVPEDDPTYDRRGVASWYGALFHGRHTANGEIFDMERLTAAHPTLPLPVYVKVTNLDNGRSAVVRVNDRGPFRNGREIDLSERTAEVLGFKRAGTANVRVRYLRRAPMDGDDGFERDYLSTRGYSQYAGTRDEDGVPEVVIAVGPPAPPGPPPAPPLPDRPDRSAVVAALQTPASSSAGPAGSDEAPQHAQASMETTGSIRPSVSESGGPMIQAGFFKNQGNAKRARGALASVGPVVVTELLDRGETYYRVRVGPFPDGIAAAAALSDVATAGYRGAKIVLNN